MNKKNTVQIGDDFELTSYELIKKAIEEDQLGISPKHSRVFRKKGYFSQVRNKEIIFDLSIEIWPPNAERFSILYIIECKNYSTKKIPVDDIEEFLYKLTQIANLGFYIKGVFISNGSFQEGALELGKNAHLMMIEVNTENDYTIKLHKTERRDEKEIDEITENIKEIEAFIFDVFNLRRVEGLKRLSKKEIAQRVNEILSEIDFEPSRLEKRSLIQDLIKHFKTKYKLKFDFENTLTSIQGKQLFGYFDIKKHKISIDKFLLGTDRFSFMLAHELGHFVLHSNLKINQQIYDNFEDSEYDFITDKYILNNYKNWIEWQANQFASSLIMPSQSFISCLSSYQYSIGISKYGHIYLDDQPINKQDFARIIEFMSKFYETTKTSVIYRLEELNLITYSKSRNNFQNDLRQIFWDTSS